MKVARLHSRITALTVLMMVLFIVPAFARAAQTSNETLSKKELKVLLKNARTSADHQRIAAYYRQEAQRLVAKSKDHEEMGAVYEKSPLPYEGKFPYGTVGVSHCRRWAQLDREQAKQAEALAALHEDVAKAAEQK